jgi:uncharacterized protein (DUF1499 family)
MEDTQTTMTSNKCMRVIVMISILLASCASPPDQVLRHMGTLAPCPGTPNCVCSNPPDNSIEPFHINGSPDQVWQELLNFLEDQPDYTIVTKNGGYVHAEARTSLMGFVDDMEFQLRSDESLIAVRSASRLGLSDLGANKKRLQAIRKALSELGVVEIGPGSN